MFNVSIQPIVQQLAIHRHRLHVGQINRKYFRINLKIFLHLVNLDRGRGELEKRYSKIIDRYS